MNWRFLVPALVELSEAAEYYEAEVPGLGLDFLNEVDAGARRVVQFPEAWGKLSENFRHCILRRFPYSLVYTINGDEILIVSVFHNSRKPLSWRRNL